jgi:hypothetical protein
MTTTRRTRRAVIVGETKYCCMDSVNSWSNKTLESNMSLDPLTLDAMKKKRAEPWTHRLIA